MEMKNVIKKVSAAIMAFTLLSVCTAVTKTVVPKSNNTITAYADFTYTCDVGAYVNLKNPKSWLNVRKGPGTGYSIVGKKYHGDFVTIYEKKGNWARIGKNQWVCFTQNSL